MMIFDKLNAAAPDCGVRLATVTYRDGKAVDIAPFFNSDSVTASQAKHLPANIQRILASAKLVPVSGKLSLTQVDAAFAKAGLSPTERMRQKSALHRAGLLD
jgi:hypothetical protein